MNLILPLYYQIKQTMRSWILNKEFSSSEKIPSENELAEQLGIASGSPILFVERTMVT